MIKNILAFIGLIASILVLGALLAQRYPFPIPPETLLIPELNESLSQVCPMLTGEKTPRQRDSQGKLVYFHPRKSDRRVYVREWRDYRPPAGAPIFYAPWPNTLCMLGEDSYRKMSPIYEAKTGICQDAARRFLNQDG